MTSTSYQVSYSLGLCVMYFGFTFWLLECFLDPVLRDRPLLRFPLMVVAIVFASIFTAKVVLMKAPLESDAYAMRHGEYAAGTVIAGIKWDSHFTDLRVDIANPSDNDYENVDINMLPDVTDYKAAIVGDNQSCHLMPNGGLGVASVLKGKGGATKITFHQVGGQLTANDDVGDIFEPLLNAQYRLQCPRLSAHSSVQIVFALAILDGHLVPKPQAPPPKSSTFSGTVVEIEGVTDLMSLLAARPDTAEVTIDGRYSCGPKRFVIHARKLHVGDGN